MERAFYAFGTMNYIRIDQMDSRGVAGKTRKEMEEELLKDMDQMCQDLDDRLSAFKADSEIGRINANAGIRPVAVRAATIGLLKRAVRYSRLSDGAFDITIRPAVALWDIGHRDEKVPEEKQLHKAHKLVNYKLIKIDEKYQTVYLRKKGQAIDLGGIAKGYAGDCVRDALVERGVISGFLNFGGTILTIGNKPDGQEWQIGIQNPVAARGTSVGTVPLTGGVLVTSAVNERFFIRDGVRYHHLLDPRTLKPAQSGVLSVTAAGSTGADLDAATTAFFVLGAEKGIALAQKLGIDALYLMEDGRILATAGFTAGGRYAFHPDRKNAVMQNPAAENVSQQSEVSRQTAGSAEQEEQQVIPRQAVQKQLQPDLTFEKEGVRRLFAGLRAHTA